VIDFIRESHMMNKQIVMLLPYFISIRPDIVKLRSGAITSRTKRVHRGQKGSGEDYMAIEFASFLIDKSKLAESENTCNSNNNNQAHQPRPVEYSFDMLYDTDSDYLSRLRPVFNIIIHMTKA